MKILLTEVTRYIGKRLFPNLLLAGHQVICLARDSKRVQELFATNENVTRDQSFALVS
jgi:nucleoside-diphosphate-sugar epimerase